MQAQKPSHDVLFAFKDDVSIALQQVCIPDYVDEAMILSRAAKIIRRDIFNAPSSTYNGNSISSVSKIPYLFLSQHW